jgi:hypothetical protein
MGAKQVSFPVGARRKSFLYAGLSLASHMLILSHQFLFTKLTSRLILTMKREGAEDHYLIAQSVGFS